VIVAAHLRLHPRPAEETSWLFGFGGPEAALEAALGVMDAPVVVSRLQLLDAATLAWLGHPSPASAALAVTVGSVPEGVRAQGSRIAEICERGEARPEPVAEPEAWWARVSEASWPATGEALTLRVGARPTDLVKALHAAGAAGRGTVAVRATAEVANGVLHLVMTGSGLAEAGSLLTRVREGLAPLGATCVVEHAPPATKPELDVWGDVGPALEPMRRLKAEMDPKGILNPGRYVGGI
jgi:glycolate dehydrogenase FAD-binding subunit